MDVRINEVSAELKETDPEAMLTPRVMARILAEVRRQLAEDEKVKRQRDVERSGESRGVR